MARHSPYHSPADIEERWQVYLDAFNSFYDRYRARPEVKHDIGIDHVSLYQAVESYFHDVARYRWWHFDDATKRVDETKQFAFTIYWLMKNRPIYIVTPIEAVVDGVRADPSAFDADPTILVNAHFALIMGMAYLNYKIHGELCEELLYSISYRDVNKESLMILASALRLILERGVDAVVLKSPNKDKMPAD